MAPVLGYWDIRGIASDIRFLLEYVGEEYTEKLYHWGPPPENNKQEWLSEKFNLGLEIPNLPYYIDGDTKITQSIAILTYIARKHNLLGDNETERCRAHLLAMQVRDYYRTFAKVAYNKDYNQLKDAYAAGLPEKLELLSKFLGDRKYALGDKICYADFMLFEYLNFKSYFHPEILKNFPVLVDYRERIQALEPISKYMNSPRFIKFPFNATPAMIGGAYSHLNNPQK